MTFKRLIALSYILTGIAIALILGIGAYAKISGKGLPIATTAPLLPNNLPTGTNGTSGTGSPTTSGGVSSNGTATPASSGNSASTSAKSSTGSTTTGSTGSTSSGSTGSTSTGSGGTSGSGSTGGGSGSGGSGGSGGTTTPPPCGGQTPCYTTATVGTHNTKTDCWVIIGSTVYNVTAYVPQHPGGQGVFNSATCGHDISAYMSGAASTGGARHSHSGGAYTILNSYKIGYDY